MDDGFVEHRFVEIYKTCESITPNDKGFWGTLQDHSAIAVSHSCDRIFTLVMIEKKLDLFQTIQNLQNLVLTSDNQSKTAVFTRLITRLLVYNEQLKEKKLYFHHSKTEQYKVHPFTTLVKKKPDTYYNLLDEIDYLFKEKQDVISVLHGFIDALFLTKHTVDANAMLTRLSNNIMLYANKNTAILSTIYDTFKQILYDYPMYSDRDKYFMIIDFLLWTNITIAPYFKIDNASTNDFLFIFLDRMLTASSEYNSISSYLVRLERIIQSGVDNDVLDIIWTGLSYALLKALTLEEQQSIMDMMQSIIKINACHISVLRIAYIPLYQLMSELNDKNASAEIKNLKNNTLDMIAYIEHYKLIEGDTTRQIKKLQEIIDSNKPYGLLIHIFVYLYEHYKNVPPTKHQLYLRRAVVTLELNLIFCAPFVHSDDQDIQIGIYDHMAEIADNYKLPVFLFFLRSLRSNSDNPAIVAHIFKEAIPSLASQDDPIMTSKILQVILSAISSGTNSSMACLGVQALLQTYMLQPRLWQELKRVFTEWVLRRKSVTLRRRIDLTNTAPIKMELAILTSMRWVCKWRSRQCAPDVLPMVISLLQSCQDLSMASLSIITTIINDCVRFGFVEARSIWNIAVVYLAQYAFDQGIKKSSLLVEQLCEFYSIAGAKSDISEPYIQFKEYLLSDFILPLLESGESDAAEHAMKALSMFPAQDIMTILPEKAAEYLKKATPENDSPNANQHLVLSVLASNELDHMRRGLFKEEHATKQPAEPVVDDTKRIVNDAGEPVGDYELAIRNKFTENWETARVAPGLRSGYAIAMLHMIDLPSTPRVNSKEELWQAIGKSKWYRFMITQFTDVSLTDHLLLRISSVGSWETFFKNTLLRDSQNDLEAMVGLLIQDLLSRLERSTIPGVTCNTALAITGLVGALRSFIPSFAASCASDVIEKLMKHYIDLAGSPLSHSAHLMSEEVQFAARFALGYLGPCIISNEKLIRSVYDNLIESAVSPNAKYRNIDTAVDLVQFANGYAAGHLVANLTAYPSMTESIENMRDTGMTALLNYCSTQTISDSRVMGILTGLASGLKPELMNEELSFAVESLQSYLSGHDINKGRLLGSLWLCTVGAKEEDHINYELSSLVESALASASSDPNLAQHFYHFTVCYTQIQYHTYLFADASNEKTQEFYNQAFAPLLNSIENDDASSNYRIASLFGIGSLFGLNYICGSRQTLYLEAQRYSAEPRQAALQKISQIAGITSRSAPTGNLKSGRVAAAVCGKLIEHVMLLQRVLDSGNEGQSKSDPAALSLLSASSEPSNYNRLNNNTSYLRAIYDQLVQLSSTSQENNLNMLLESLIKTPGPLPPVNWFNVLVKITKISPQLQNQCFSFAATHGTTSFSLSEFLMTQATAIVKNINSITTSNVELLFNTGALNTLLELSGLGSGAAAEASRRRGMNAVIKKISISSSRILELIQLLCKKFQWLGNSQEDLLSQIASHLDVGSNGGDDKQKLITAIREQVYESITLPLLNDPKIHDSLIEEATECGITDATQILPTGRLNDWKDLSNDLMYNRIVSLCKYYELDRAEKQSLIRYFSAAMTHLIGLAGDKVELAWDLIAEMIGDDCDDNDGSILGWIIRVLDAFVVYISSLTGPEEYNDEQIMHSIQTGLRYVMLKFISSPRCDSLNEIHLDDTVYLMSYSVSIIEDDDSKLQFEQIVKRVFKLTDMVEELGSSLVLEFFKQVSRTFPGEYIVQNESKY